MTEASPSSRIIELLQSSDSRLLVRVISLAVLGGWLVYGHLFYAGYFLEIGFESLTAFSLSDIAWSWSLRLLSEWALYYALFLAIFFYFVSFRKLSFVGCLAVALLLVLSGLLSDLVVNFLDKDSPEVNFNQYFQTLSWLFGVGGIVISAESRLTRSMVIGVVVLSSLSFFAYGYYTARIKTNPRSATAVRLQLLEEKGSERQIFLLFSGSQGVLYWEKSIEGGGVQIKYSPRSSIKSMGIGEYKEVAIWEKSWAFTVGILARWRYLFDKTIARLV